MVHEYGQSLEQYGTSTEEGGDAEGYNDQSYESQLLDPGSFEGKLFFSSFLSSRNAESELVNLQKNIQHTKDSR